MRCVVFVFCFLAQIMFANSSNERVDRKAGFLPSRCARIKLKPDALESTRQWFQTMKDHEEDLLLILEGQGVFVEAVFLDRIGDDNYLIYFIKEESRDKSRSFISERFLKQEPLIIGHQEYKRNCWEERIELESLFNMDRIR